MTPERELELIDGELAQYELVLKTVKHLKEQRALVVKRMEDEKVSKMTFEEKFQHWIEYESLYPKVHSKYVIRDLPNFYELMTSLELHRHKEYDIREDFNEYIWMYVYDLEARAKYIHDNPNKVQRIQLAIEAAKELMNSKYKSFTFDW